MMSERLIPASAVVLAGGLSRRLGRDKRRLRLWGEGGPTLLERTIATVGALCADVVVVLNDPETWPGLAARVVGDVYPQGGALGGIYSGLQAAAGDYALVVACDMPLLSAPLLAAMLARPRDYDALLPRSPAPGETRNRLDVEPLHAIYAKACLGPMRESLEAGRLQIASFFPAVHVAIMEPDEIAPYDPRGLSFLNINTVEQMADAQALLGGRG
jgi:molybdopterin-guanine dinucleotide biosynthesis protein A